MNIGLARGLSIGGGLLSGEANRRDAERLYEQQRQDNLAQQAITNKLEADKFGLEQRQHEDLMETQERGEQRALEQFALQSAAPGSQFSEELIGKLFADDSPYRMMLQHHSAQGAIDPLSGTRPALRANPEFQQQDPTQGYSFGPEGFTQAEGYQPPPDQREGYYEGGAPLSVQQEEWSTPGRPAQPGYYTLPLDYAKQLARDEFDFRKETQEAANLINISDADTRRVEADATARGVSVQQALADLAHERFRLIEHPTAEQLLAYQKIIQGEDYLNRQQSLAERGQDVTLAGSIFGQDFPTGSEAQKIYAEAIADFLDQYRAGRIPPSAWGTGASRSIPQ